MCAFGTAEYQCKPSPPKSLQAPNTALQNSREVDEACAAVPTAGFTGGRSAAG